LVAYSNDELKKFTQFQIVADKEYLRKIEEGQKKFARIYAAFDYDVKFEVRGYTFPFTLFADPEVQTFYFQFWLWVLLPTKVLEW
jgi:CRISPR-associated endoribonuclease Cas6